MTSEARRLLFSRLAFRHVPPAKVGREKTATHSPAMQCKRARRDSLTERHLWIINAVSWLTLFFWGEPPVPFRRQRALPPLFKGAELMLDRGPGTEEGARAKNSSRESKIDEIGPPSDGGRRQETARLRASSSRGDAPRVGCA